MRKLSLSILQTAGPASGLILPIVVVIDMNSDQSLYVTEILSLFFVLLQAIVTGMSAFVTRPFFACTIQLFS